MDRIVCDTNVVSGLMRAEPSPVAHYPSAVKLISVVTAAELRAGANMAGWGERRRGELERTIRAYPQVPIDEEITFAWAELRAACQKAGTAVSENDLWIAATAVRIDTPVASLDAAFARIPGIRLIDASGVERRT